MKRTEKTGFQKKQTEPMGDVQIQEFLDMIAPAVIKFETDHFICGNTYRCVWALREYPTATEEQAILSHLGEKDGVTLRIYTRHVTPVEERKIISNAANKNRMDRSNTNDLQQTGTGRKQPAGRDDHCGSDAPQPGTASAYSSISGTVCP